MQDKEETYIKIVLVGKKELLKKYVYNDSTTGDLEMPYKYKFDNISAENYAHIRNHDISIILADDEIEEIILLCKKCREIIDNPIIILGKPKEEYAVKLLEAGADDYIKAPISKRVLDILIYTHIRRENRFCHDCEGDVI